jgi:hypothetical protein
VQKKKIVLLGMSVFVVMIFGLGFKSVAVAASQAVDGSGSIAEREALLGTVSKQCQPQWCKPEIVKMIDKYAAVIFWCKKKDCENDAAYLKRAGGKWKLVEQGTGIEPDDLKKDGFPDRIANDLMKAIIMKRRSH